MRRRDLALGAAAVALLLAAVLGLSSCGDAEAAEPGTDHRVLILGIDGMDPDLLRDLMEQGRLPNFERLAERGTFLPLGTSAPPQSPVAWSSFITGAGPGTHQIFDFIHRRPRPEDPEVPVEPYLSTSTVQPPSPDLGIPLGPWRLPLTGGEVVSLRRGRAFWQDLVEHGVPTTIYRVPANYPAPEIEGRGPLRCLCGMGTPDLLGTYGVFTLFTSDPLVADGDVSGGRVQRVRFRDQRATATLAGPPNHLRRPDDTGARPELTLDLEIVRDPTRDVVRVETPGGPVLLNQGEWSDWVPLELHTGLPGSAVLGPLGVPTSLSAMVRLFLRDVHPHLELYVSPLNLDPLAPVNPIGTPGSFPRELAEACGRYYTTGIPEDTSALRAGALDEDEFLQQVRVLKRERLAHFRYALERFDAGVLFFYFGHVDQLSHIFWRDRDPLHPGHVPEEAEKYGGVIDELYVEMDGLLGEAMAALDEGDAVIAMSDHGFTSFRHGLNLNTWLIRNGYLVMRDGEESGHLFSGRVDWSRTRAYALGLNGLYVNLAGREKHGIVPESGRMELLAEIAGKLEGLRDEQGRPVVKTVYLVDRFHRGADRQVAPDVIVGYADTYRASWETAEGGAPEPLIEDNHDRWCGDHCIEHTIVPGILVTDLPVTVADPDLTDLAPTILAQFGIAAPPEMTGRVLTGTGATPPGTDG